MPVYYQSLTTRDTRTLTEATLTSLTRNIDTYLDDLDRLTLIPYYNDEVMRALRTISNPTLTSASQRFFATQILYTTFSKYLQDARTDIRSIVVLPLDGSVSITTNDSSSSAKGVANYPFAQQAWYQKAREADGNDVYIDPHPQDYLPGQTSSQVFSVARLIKDPDTFHPLAVITADADTNILKDIVSGITLNVRSAIAVLGTDQRPIYSSPSLSKQVSQEIAQKATPLHDAQDSYIDVSRPTAKAPWKVIILLSNSDINAESYWLYIVGTGFAISGFGLTFLVFFILSRRIINPFQHMMGAMQKVQEGDLQIRIATEGDDEIAKLGQAFNIMVGRLNDLIEQEYKATLSLRNAEYHALQAQIQPHFLYNILNTFSGLNRLGERQALENAILSLSAMLRYILSKDKWVTLKDELLFLQKYCALQKLRFQNKMTFVIQHDDALANFRMPKVLLQPLVENAIIHGMEPAASPCELQVIATCKREDETPTVYISIQDNGVGFAVQTQTNSPGLGLSNVQERLKLAYENASLSITSPDGGGTQVVIVIPISEEVVNNEDSHCR
jgi:two-component system sensor histidine kinase YesM